MRRTCTAAAPRRIFFVARPTAAAAYIAHVTASIAIDGHRRRRQQQYISGEQQHGDGQQRNRKNRAVAPAQSGHPCVLAVRAVRFDVTDRLFTHRTATAMRTGQPPQHPIVRRRPPCRTARIRCRNTAAKPKNRNTPTSPSPNSRIHTDACHRCRTSRPARRPTPTAMQPPVARAMHDGHAQAGIMRRSAAARFLWTHAGRDERYMLGRYQSGCEVDSRMVFLQMTLRNRLARPASVPRMPSE